jgi:hypothetical protein
MHLDISDKIITRSHWSCCGNTEKHSVSCRPGASLSSKGRQVKRAEKTRSFSESFDPEVDSEFTEYDCQEAAESDLSIEEYNDGPVVWSPSSSDRKVFDSEVSEESLQILKNDVRSKGSISRSPPASTELNAATQSGASHSPAMLQRIERLNRLYDKFVQKGFSVDFSRVRSKLGMPPVRLHGECSVGIAESARPSVRLPDVSEELEAVPKV